MGRHKSQDNSQVFDVSKPGRSAPSHTARPVIVDHRQVANDPMVTGASDASTTGLMTHASKPVVPIQISSDQIDHTPDSPSNVTPDQSDNFFGNTPETAAGEQSAYKPDLPTEPNPEIPQSFSSFNNAPDQSASVQEESPANPSGETQSPADSPPLPAELTAPGVDDPVGLSNAASPVSAFPPLGSSMPEGLPATADSSTNQHDVQHSGDNSGVSEGLKNNEQLPPVPENIGEIEHLPLPAHSMHGHFTDEPRKRRWFLPALILFLIGTFLVLDAGIVGSGNLPFQIIKEKEEAAAENAPSVEQAPIAQTLPAEPAQAPAGFTQYVLPNSPLSFTYPTVWGTPAVTSELGFTKRGGSNKSDGTFAHLINFAENKDIQLALTSNKYLPAKRAVQYFDFLQWCSGTHDAKFYRQQLLYSTTSGVDSPGTITCNDGPLGDGTKIDELTIVQKSTKDSTGKVIGDVYTKNLSDKEYVVLRVKDTTMAGAESIKQLLTSVKVAPATAGSN